MNIPHLVYTIENRMLASPTPNDSPNRSTRPSNKEKWSERGGFAEEDSLEGSPLEVHINSSRP